MANLFTAQVPANTDGTDAQPYTLGTVFTSSVDGTVTGIRWRFPDTLPSGDVVGGLFTWDSDTTGALLASATFASPVAGQWNTVAITPQAIVAGQYYVAAVFTPDRYVATNNFFADELVNGVLSAPANDEVIPRRNGKLRMGVGSIDYPNQSFSAACYFADVEFVEGAPVEVPVGQTTEADTAQPLGRAKTTGAGGALETDTATAVGRAKASGTGAAAETGTASPVAAAKAVAAGQAGETDTATPIAAAKAATAGRAEEVDVAFTIAAAKRITLGIATEADNATAVAGAKALTVGPATETDLAFVVGERTTIRITLGVAVETDQAQTITPFGADMAFYDGPCQPWEPIWTCALPAGSEAVTGFAVQAASELLWVKSGRRFGVCEVTLRPCRDGCADGQVVDGWWQWEAYPQPRFYRGVWTNVTCGSCTTGCSCAVVSEVTLPSPVADVIEVRIDGVVLDPSAYRVDDYRKLVRTDGGEWPDCNDLSKNDGAPGTWSVTAEVGEEVPQSGRLALGELAAEIAKGMVCDKTCALPSNLASLARAGVSQQFFDPSEINDIYDSGRIGLRFCDMFLAAYNPGGLPDESRVHAIDQPRPRVRTL